ncbi:MAG: glycosyltransferase [Bacteroidaceae bacterium]|nr:glycosyltransferase [Bacteroidaceae bacterium]
MKLSLIIPVYNVEQYISHCLQSCLCQPSVGVDDYELVVVNDGTKDNSMQIVEEMTRGCSNVTIINQCNQGLSMARNAGLRAAKGEYVWFIDSDDWIEEGCLSGILERLKNTKVDGLQLQYRNVYSDATPFDEHYSTIDGVVSGKDWLVEDEFFIPVPFMVYRREFLLQNNLSFYPGIYHEDNDFKPRMLFLAKTCASYDKVAYNYYRGNMNSITATPKLRNGQDIFLVMNRLYSFVDEYNIQGRYRRAFYTQIGNAMKMALRILQQLNVADANILIDLMRQNPHLFKCMCSADKWRIQLGGLLMYLHLPLGLRIFKLYV